MTNIEKLKEVNIKAEEAIRNGNLSEGRKLIEESKMYLMLVKAENKLNDILFG